MTDIDQTNKTNKIKKVLNDNYFNKPFWQWLAMLFLTFVLIIIAQILIANPKVQTEYAHYLLSNAEEWPADFRAAFDQEDLNAWQPTDGVINENVTNIATSNNSLEITFAPTGETTVRDAFYNQNASVSEDFLLTMKMESPGS